jgi:hypothetical protein
MKPRRKMTALPFPSCSGDDVPNVNPVQDKTESVKLTEDGKVDPTTIAKAEDFGDWEEETGCRG